MRRLFSFFSLSPPRALHLGRSIFRVRARARLFLWCAPRAQLNAHFGGRGGGGGGRPPFFGRPRPPTPPSPPLFTTRVLKLAPCARPLSPPLVRTSGNSSCLRALRKSASSRHLPLSHHHHPGHTCLSFSLWVSSFYDSQACGAALAFTQHCSNLWLRYLGSVAPRAHNDTKQHCVCEGGPID